MAKRDQLEGVFGSESAAECSIRASIVDQDHAIPLASPPSERIEILEYSI
jgi:hypothetical protein